MIENNYIHKKRTCSVLEQLAFTMNNNLAPFGPEIINMYL